MPRVSAANNLNEIIMAAPNKNTGMFERILNKYKSQYMPNKLEGLAMTMDGYIALATGDDEYTAIVGDHLETYPAETVITEIPFYSIHRQIEQVKAGDYMFLNTTIEGRKLAKVMTINKTKDGHIKGLTVLRFNGATEETTITTDKLTNITTVEVVINLLENINGFQFPGMANGQQNPFMSMMLMKEFMGNKDESSFEKFLMMSMFMNGGNGFQFPGMANGQQNPFMSMMLMKEFMGNKDGFNLEKFLTMSMFMNGNNPFAMMSQPTSEQPARKTRSDKGTTRKPVDNTGTNTDTPDETPAEQ